ncbi:GTP cyclohydrolase II [Nocardioides sp. CER19]|uniref:GTP cyclohydrolase II n=1 Tax=Nocardioides sp. CER19 TaxID=3038538 RepID=UPI0024495D8D|nr:GTP cyclohydrolase II [Nocardioides sp. CER19]MDH2416866.1 GTP cyclohydrolase II [Nocardioides sp. CER19]
MPEASIRNQVRLPVRLPDGRVVTGRLFSFDGLVDGREHVALGLGDRSGPPSTGPAGVPLVRLHSECLTGDVLGSRRCDCGPQLDDSLDLLGTEGGYLLYLRQEGRGIGLYAKIDAYTLQDTGIDTFDANLALGYPEDARDYTVAAQMLRALGVGEIRLLSNNPDKTAQLTRLGIRVAEQVPMTVHLTPTNQDYLAAKEARSREY